MVASPLSRKCGNSDLSRTGNRLLAARLSPKCSEISTAEFNDANAITWKPTKRKGNFCHCQPERTIAVIKWACIIIAMRPSLFFNVASLPAA